MTNNTAPQRIKKYECPKCGFIQQYPKEMISIETLCPECLHKFLSKNVPIMERINDEST